MIMKKFVIAIEETVVQHFEIKAENIELAMEMAEKKYNNGEVVLEPGEVCFKQMAVLEPYEEIMEWTEF